MSAFEFFIAGTISAATVYLLAAIGELVAEKSGMLNLGVEGIMATAAAAAFIVVYTTDSHVLGFVVGGLAGVAVSMIFAVVSITFLANQVATGLAVGILGLGMSALIGKNYESLTLSPAGDLHFPLLGELPFVGPALFSHNVVVYLSLISAFVIGYTLSHTKLGLIIRSVGENPQAAQSLGYPVHLVRYGAVAFGGLFAGFAGAYASTIYTPLWADGMIAGRGWIAVALVVFGTWKTGRIVLGAYLFGLISLGELMVQSIGIDIPSQLLSSMPYIVTIVVLASISSDRARLRLHAPFSLGETYDGSR
ncbi:ABC transporter permease [Qingshengfaniella alkalisoli]|uniref:ABC transporter permease n=1 Tax=Qingshengfaniella alkalisoli TaxID=2599296 RepID=A0A5B8I9S2_9RHOB|nr:ABC transporter permease [Qingshengfaniella alkalisoli]QDY71075.1 ABC transporter permease [Qingshengfaniella alkalisoli]